MCSWQFCLCAGFIFHGLNSMDAYVSGYAYVEFVNAVQTEVPDLCTFLACVLCACTLCTYICACIRGCEVLFLSEHWSAVSVCGYRGFTKACFHS